MQQVSPHKKSSCWFARQKSKEKAHFAKLRKFHARFICCHRSASHDSFLHSGPGISPHFMHERGVAAARGDFS